MGTRPYAAPVVVTFSGEIWYWRGPSPFHFITVPDEHCDGQRGAATVVSYGWGMIPVTAQVGNTTWTTSLFPKNGRYIVPVKFAVLRSESLDVGDSVTVRLTVDV